MEAQVSCNYKFRSNSWQCPLVFRSQSYEADALDIKPQTEGSKKIKLDTTELDNTGGWMLLSNLGEKELVTHPLTASTVASIKYEISVRKDG